MRIATAIILGALAAGVAAEHPQQPLSLERVHLADGRVLEGRVELSTHASYRSVVLVHDGREEGAMRVHVQDIVRREPFVWTPPPESQSEAVSQPPVSAETATERLRSELQAEALAIAEERDALDARQRRLVAKVQRHNRGALRAWAARLTADHMRPIAEAEILREAQSVDAAAGERNAAVTWAYVCEQVTHAREAQDDDQRDRYLLSIGETLRREADALAVAMRYRGVPGLALVEVPTFGAPADAGR